MRPLFLALMLALVTPVHAQDSAPPPLPRERPTAEESAAEADAAGDEAEADEPAGEAPESEQSATNEAMEEIAEDLEGAPEPDAATEADEETLVPLPRERPAPASLVPDAVPERAEDVADTSAESPRIYQVACPAVIGGLVTATMIPPISEQVCRVQSPYQVTALSVGGRSVALSSPGTMNCEMATALGRWVERVSAYTEAIFNEPVTEIAIGTTYLCRQRNNGLGINVSEHGFANAADVTGFTLRDGTRISLPDDWDDTSDFAARTMRHAHDAACGYFTTVLGPEANALHRDHLHLDLGCHGQSCTAKLCE